MNRFIWIVRIFGILIGIVWLVFAAVAFRNSAAGWSAEASDIGFWWTIIGIFLTLAAGGGRGVLVQIYHNHYA